MSKRTKAKTPARWSTAQNSNEQGEAMKIGELTAAFNAEYAAYRAEQDRIDAQIEKRKQQIERLKRKAEKLPRPFWTEAIVKPIYQEVVKHMPGYKTRADETFDTFGILAHCPVFFECESGNGKHLKMFDFVPEHYDEAGGLSLSIINHKKKIHDYPIGSIADMNNMQYERIQLDSEMEISELAKLV